MFGAGLGLSKSKLSRQRVASYGYVMPGSLYEGNIMSGFSKSRGRK